MGTGNSIVIRLNKIIGGIAYVVRAEETAAIFILIINLGKIFPPALLRSYFVIPIFCFLSLKYKSPWKRSFIF